MPQERRSRPGPCWKHGPNCSFSPCNRIFGNTIIATHILDRMLHHSTTVNITGNSHRRREKVKAGFWPGGRDRTN
ncbi:MAG: ATP-binding protein [bacterium]|nr:ATP-binding protein [bacterium]